MPRTQILLISALGGCTPSIGQAIRYTDKGMATLDVVLTQAVDVHSEATQIAIRNCASAIKSGTEEQRISCLEKQGFSSAQIAEFEEALALIRDAYDTLADALNAMKQALPDIDEALSSARQVKP